MSDSPQATDVQKLSARPDDAHICATIAQSGYFDALWYLAQNPDVAASGFDPVVHYVRYGEAEMRNPGPNFNLRDKWRSPGGSGNILYDYLTSCGRSGMPPGGKPVVPVVFAANEKYMPYLSVAIASLTTNASQGANYQLYVFYTDAHPQTVDLLMSQQTENVHVEPVNVASLVREIVASCYVSSHVTCETYYRIIIPILLKEFSKVVYLDCDLILNEDIRNLYNIDVANWLLAMSPDPVGPEVITDAAKNYMPNDMRDYYNAGVILINNSAFIENNIYDKFCDCIKSGIKYQFHDQDIMNIICQGRIKNLEPSWNWQWQYYVKEFYRRSNRKIFAAYARSFERPAIVHFNSDRKPWKDRDDHFAPMFWHYARLSPFFRELQAACPYALNDILENGAFERGAREAAL